MVVGLLVFAGVISVNPKSITPTGTATQTDSGKLYIAGQECGSDGLANLEVRIKNARNSTLEYIAAPVTYAENGVTIKNSVTGNAGGSGVTFASASDVLKCKVPYKLVVVDSDSVAARDFGEVIPDSAVVTLDGVGAKSADVQFKLYTLAYGNDNGTVVADGIYDFDQDFISASKSASLGGNLEGRFDLRTAASDSQFGSYEAYLDSDTGEYASAYICFFGNTTETSASSVDINYPGIVKRVNDNSLPKWCKNNAPSGTQAMAAWVIEPVVGQRVVSGTYSINCNLADCSAAEDDRFTFVDAAFYRGSDGKLHYGTTDDSNNDIGETNRYFAVNKA